MNRWNIIALYAVIVCLISIVMSLFNITTLSQNVLKITIPWYLETGVPEVFTLKDNESFRRTHCPREKEACDLSNLSEESITQLREKERNKAYEQQLVFQKKLALKSAIDEFISLLIATIFFTIHWRVLKRALSSQLPQ